MNLDKTKTTANEAQVQARNTTLIGVFFALIFGGLSLYVVFGGDYQQARLILPIFITSLLVVWAARTGRHVTGSYLLILVISAQTIASPLTESGLGLPSALGAIALIGIISLATLPRKNIGRILIAGLIVASASVLIDLFAPATRPPGQSIDVRWVFSVIAFLTFLAYITREYSALDIRTKITLGILATGGIALAILAIFALNRSTLLINFLSERLEISVKLLAEEQLTNTVNSEAATIDQFFKNIEIEVENLAAYRVSLERERNKLNLGNYWDGNLQIAQLSTGQYGNPTTDPSSVFIPINTEITEGLIGEINTSAYLDFMAPKILEKRPEILSIYNITPKGVTRYYPNINLAAVLPPDFDATSRPYYQITNPSFNQERRTKWAIPYVDATGGGLVVTVASPVYFGNEFNGIIAADIQLSKVAEQAALIKVGSSGYAMIIDVDGHVIYMPDAGYAMYGINPETLVPEEYFKQTVLGNGNNDIKSITQRMAAGASGLNTINVNGVETYIAYTQIKSTGYILALVVPTAEMQQAIISTNSDVQAQVQGTVRLGALIFIGLLFFAIIVSVVISQIIGLPILRLTLAANRIIDGYLTTQATVTTQDEIGTLAEAFNTMTYRLRENLSTLEKRVEDRTAEITIANEKIERRAKQFASISEISRIINQTQNLLELLPQIVQSISQQFNFYHTGIFLLDANKEYAILRAANSEGGQKMLYRNHKLLVGQTGIVGYVSRSGKPRIALDTGSDSVYFNNPDLPNTRSEMALPLLKSGGEIIGVLDVQSTVPNAFSQEDIDTLSALADQVAVAITNALLYEETQKTLVEGDIIYRQNLRVGWEKYTRSSNLVGVQRKGLQTNMLTEPIDINGVEPGELKNAQTPPSHINIPLRLRGAKIGSLSIENKNNRQFTQDELDVISAILERAALAMENARLLEESQRRAAREQTISEMSARIGSGTEIEAILQTAVRELGAQISGTQISVEIGGENE
ncbi:MAG: GAF domain-containing protein [Anaerolineales bacterium]|nr:GAF domain-containing protein [Anaerolineales bacterium]